MRDELADLVSDVLSQADLASVVMVGMNVPTMLAVLVIVDHTVETMPHHEMFADEYEDLARLRDNLQITARAMATPNHPIWDAYCIRRNDND